MLRLRDHYYNLAFALVDAFASLEVGAVIVLHAHIAEQMGMPEELSGYVITGYLYPLFGMLMLALLFERRLREKLSPGSLLLLGLVLFVVGNLICALTPSLWGFFGGRVVMSVGAALSFVGQLWTLCVHFLPQLARILVWGELGAAFGDMAGPLVGGAFAQISHEGWRFFFLFDAFVGILALSLSMAGLRGKMRVDAVEERDKGEEKKDGLCGLVTGVAWQVIVSALLVGSLYLFSDQLQQKMDEGPLLVGGINFLASLGTVLGAFWYARLSAESSLLPLRCATGLLFALAGLASALSASSVLLSAVPLFASGVFMGLACVAIYTTIVAEASSTQFLRRTLVYLLGMQVGNALGVQMISFAEGCHMGVFSSALTLAALPLSMMPAIFWFPRLFSGGIRRC